MTISGFFQFIIGFILGTIFFTAGIGGGIYFFLSTMSVKPSKPVYSEEQPEKVAQKRSSATNPKNNNQSSSIFPKNKTQESASENESPSNNEDLPSGAYRARVTWSTGLSLRAEPDQSAERIGGVGYNWEIIILNYSDDRKWQRIRIPSSGQEGWVKAGNVEKIE